MISPGMSRAACACLAPKYDKLILTAALAAMNSDPMGVLEKIKSCPEC
jgi:hypothetical protein